VDPAPPECLIRSESVKEEENRKRPFERKIENGDTWYLLFDDDVCAIRLAKRYLESVGLEKLGQSVSKVRELRNDVAHNEPTPRLMADASDKMANENLWSRDSRFLTMPLAQNVLRDLGEKDPERLCDGLIATVRSRLLDLKSDN
jgi:ERCC4-related helicase